MYPHVPMDWPALSRHVAFGKVSAAGLDKSLSPSPLGLSCKGKTALRRNAGLIGGLRPEVIKQPEISAPKGLVAQPHSSIPLTNLGVQNKAPYVWALVDLESQQVRAMGNLATLSH